MELVISVLSDDSDLAVAEATSLKKNFNFYAPELKVRQLEKQLDPDEAGLGVMEAVLQVFLGKEFINNVVSLLRGYIEKRADIINAKKARIQFEIKDSTGKTISVVLENVKEAQNILESINNMVK